MDTLYGEFTNLICLSAVLYTVFKQNLSAGALAAVYTHFFIYLGDNK